MLCQLGYERLSYCLPRQTEGGYWGFGSIYRLHENPLNIIVRELSFLEYPDNPAFLSKSYGKYSGKKFTLVQKSDGLFAIVNIVLWSMSDRVRPGNRDHSMYLLQLFLCAFQSFVKTFLKPGVHAFKAGNHLGRPIDVFLLSCCIPVFGRTVGNGAKVWRFVC